MRKEIKNATNKQVDDALEGNLFVVRRNKTNGFDINQYCTIEEAEENKHQLAELKAKLEELEGQYAYECECNKQFVECQEENERLKAENERLKSNITHINQNIRNSAKKDYESIKSLEEEIEAYKQQLKEKESLLKTYDKELLKYQKYEKEIGKLLGDENLDIVTSKIYLEDITKTNTHQVCEKIRNNALTIQHKQTGNINYMVYEVPDFVFDEIEKGESNAKNRD